MKSIKLSLIAIVMLFAVIPVYGQFGQAALMVRNKIAEMKAAKKAAKDNVYDKKNSKSDDVVVLVVSADGETKDEATKVALRSAIEQAYGTFVSANTTILNDELVKDEIVTVSSGNILGYEEIASALLPNGRQSVTLKASVCISKLVGYAKSKGASTEFAGATFAMNMKMKELNKKNEQIVLENLLKQVELLIPFAYDMSLRVAKNPYLVAEGKYIVTLSVIFDINDNYIKTRELLYSTLRSISLSEEEKKEYSYIGLQYNHIRLNMWSQKAKEREADFYLRNNARYFINNLHQVFRQVFNNYKIVDNNGKTYVFKDKGGPTRGRDDCFEIGRGAVAYEEITVSNDEMMKISEFKVEKKY